MTCEQIQPKLYLMADGELPENDSASVATHLLHCQRCKSDYDRLQSENQSLFAALVNHNLPDTKIDFLEKKVMHQIALPLHVTVLERFVSLMERLFLIVLIFVSYFVLALLQSDTASLYAKIAQSLAAGSPLFNFARDLAVVIFTATLMIIFRNSLSWLSDRMTKGGLLSCL